MSGFLFSSDTGEEMGVKWYSTSAIYGLPRKTSTELEEKYYTLFS
jgi:hypothetical protein